MTACELGEIIGRQMALMPAGRAISFLCGGFVAPVIGKIPDWKWEEMGREVRLPCGQAECNCERLRTEVFAALDSLRTDFLEQTADIPT